MPEMTRAQIQARLARHVRFYPDDAEGIGELRRQYREAALEDSIRRLVEKAPPLSAEQRERLAAIFHAVQ